MKRDLETQSQQGLSASAPPLQVWWCTGVIPAVSDWGPRGRTTATEEIKANLGVPQNTKHNKHSLRSWGEVRRSRAPIRPGHSLGNKTKMTTAEGMRAVCQETVSSDTVITSTGKKMAHLPLRSND